MRARLGLAIALLVAACGGGVTLTSATPISNAITFQDPLYHAGSSAPCGR